MAETLFLELSLIIIIATLISIIMRAINQPMIIGYLLTGIFAGPMFLKIVNSSGAIATLSQIGIIFLLFIVGLSLNMKTLKEMGKPAIITGVGQVLFTSIFGYLIANLLGFNHIEGIYIGIALSFSSTIIIVKLLTDKKEIDTLHGKISVGFLLVQDFIALLVLLFLSARGTNSNILLLVGETIIKGIALVAGLYIVTNYILPKVLHFMAKSQELLFLFSIAWALFLSVMIEKLGFGIEIGALIAGISIASSPYNHEIISKIKPLRDFFIIIFFVLLGTQMVIGNASSIILSAIIFSLFVLIGNPLILMFILGRMGYNKRTGFMAGLTVAQISEFSLILIIFGRNIGHLSQDIVSMLTIVGIITFAGSTYLMMYNSRIYHRISKLLNVFERKNAHDKSQRAYNYKIVLFGYNRIGYSLLKSFVKLRKKFLVVDYNPEIISMLKEMNYQFVYGDAEDIELLDELNLDKIEMAISTIPDLETDLLIIKKIRDVNRRAVIIITSHHIDDAFKLYEAGADYVILPHFLGGEHASALIEEFGTDINKFIKHKYQHLEELHNRKKFGHEHPKHL